MEQLTVMTASMGGNVANIDFLRPIIANLGMKLVVISEWDDADIKWDRKTWLTELNRADIIICAQRPQLQPAKSNNRVTQAQYLGKPVIASALPAYKEAIVDGETGFICETANDWENRLRQLRDDPELRNRMGQAAKKSAQQLYSIDAVGSFWLHVLSRLAKESCSPPKCDIVIPTWNNLKLLQECIKSIRANTDWPYQIIVVNSGSDGTKDWLEQQPDIIHTTVQERLHFSAANNIGIKFGNSPYVCLLNDDTIVARHWLSAMMHEAMKPGMGAVNPFSNCDKGWLHNEDWVVDGVQLNPGMSYADVEKIIPQLYTQKRTKVVTPRTWVAFFCTVIPREAIEKVGSLDENFKSGCEDLDYCKRLEKLGYRFCTTYDSVVFHFGGSTRKNAEKFSFDTHHREDQENHAYLDKKYKVEEIRDQGIQDTKAFKPALLTPLAMPKLALVPERFVPPVVSNRPTFVMYTGAGWERWSPANIDKGGIGGSETCAFYVCREFAKKGYNVVLYGDPLEPGVFNGVNVLSHEQFDPSRKMDIFVSSRRPDVFAAEVNATKKICWVHDIFLHHDPKAYIFQDKIDKFFVLSPWHQQFFCQHHNIPVEKTFVTRDGVDLSRFQQQLPRVRGRMIYSSSPDRGLDVLLDCMPLIRKRVPEAHLKVFYGFDNWKKAVEVRKNQHEIAWMQRIESQLHQPGVEYVGRIGQKELAKEFLQAELWGYPTAFTETFCITACEAMAAGVPVVTSNLAALSTTVGVDGGVLIDGHNASEAYRNAFVEVCVYVLSQRPVWEELSERGKRKAQRYGWETIADEWLKELK